MSIAGYILEKNGEDMRKKRRFSTYDYILIPLMAVLTCAGGLIRLPLPPVPFTLQTLFVYLAGLILGQKKGVYSQLLFLMLGLSGLPVFSGGGGPSYVLHPTFGYLLGFPLAAFIMGHVKGFSLKKVKTATIVRAAAAVTVILIPGALYVYLNLTFIAGGASSISPAAALSGGVLVFLPGEIIKIMLAFIILKRLAPYLRLQ